MGDAPHDRGGDGAAEVAMKLRQRNGPGERARHGPSIAVAGAVASDGLLLDTFRP